MNVTERSINSLQWFYTVVISLAVVYAVKQFIIIDEPTGVVTFDTEFLINFIAFILLVIPFHQGANRYLDETYLSDISSHKLTGLVDFLFFFVEGMAFYAMAILIKNNIYFYKAIMLVLFIDIVWLVFVYFANPKTFDKIKNWLWLNSITAILLAYLIFSNHLDPPIVWYFTGGLLILRTIGDYVFCWDFYWPKFETST